LWFVPSRHRRDAAQVLTFRTTAWSSFAPPTRRMPLGRYQDIPRADPGGRVTPRFWHRLIRFRRFCSGSLALASLDHACLSFCPDLTATLTTTAFDRSSLQWLEISTRLPNPKGPPCMRQLLSRLIFNRLVSSTRPGFRWPPRAVTAKGGRRPSRSDLSLTVTSTVEG